MNILREGTSVLVPSEFINEYLSDLSLDQIRLYLMILGAKADRNVPFVDFIEDRLRISKKAIYENLGVLEQLGLISLDGRGTEFMSVRVLEHPQKRETSVKESHDNSYIFEVEGIKGSPLSAKELELFMFIKNSLFFDDDLIYFLARMCKERGCFSTSYINAIALNWHDNGIDSVEKAKTSRKHYDDIVYTALSHLGRNGQPTAAEADVVLKWKYEFKLSDDLICYACDITSVNTSKNRLNYADSILSEWHGAGIDSVKKAKEQSALMESQSHDGKTKDAPDNREHYFKELERLFLEN